MHTDYQANLAVRHLPCAEIDVSIALEQRVSAVRELVLDGHVKVFNKTGVQLEQKTDKAPTLCRPEK